MNILLTGGTGFIGSNLIKQLILANHHVYVLTRYPKKHHDSAYVSYISEQYPMHRLPFIHAVVNLAGDSIFGYWSTAKKTRVIQSRIQTTEKLMERLIQMDQKPHVFISGSAIGYYGMSHENIYTEATTTSGNDFLAHVSTKWEETARFAEDLGIRTVYTRFGIVLDKKQGALPMMALPVKLGIGGKIGSGKQWLSWIHIDDCIRLLLFSLYNPQIRGPLNMTAPFPKQNETFTKILAKTLRRPVFIKSPSIMFKLALGDMHQLITNGQFVYPQKAIDHDFTFHYPHLNNALTEIYRP